MFFSVAGHHQYAKGAQLYCQLVKKLETLPEYKETFEILKPMGTMLFITLVMNDLVPGVTFVLSRD